MNGSKVFISHAAHAGLFLVMASIDRSKQHAGVTAFLVDVKRTQGIAVRELPMRTLRRDNLAEVAFEDAFVRDDALLGEPGKGFPILGAALDMGRYSVAARCVGQAQRCLDLTLPYARERTAFGQAIGSFQLVQQKIAEHAVPHRASAAARVPPRAHEGRRHRARIARILDGQAHGQPGRGAERARRHPDLRRLRAVRGIRDRPPAARGQVARARRGHERAAHETDRRYALELR